MKDQEFIFRDQNESGVEFPIHSDQMFQILHTDLPLSKIPVIAGDGDVRLDEEVAPAGGDDAGNDGGLAARIAENLFAVGRKDGWNEAERTDSRRDGREVYRSACRLLRQHRSLL